MSETNAVKDESGVAQRSELQPVVMCEYLCKCGHDMASHEDYDFNPHECHKCDCVQFVFADDT